MKKAVLLSNTLMHYRVSVYNYFARRFRANGWNFIVRSDEMQKENPYRVDFDFAEMPLDFSTCQRSLRNLNPDVTILFLHLRQPTIWPLVHWLKATKRPVVLWMKAMNYDKRGSVLSRLAYNYMHTMVDALILYSDYELRHVNPKLRHKVFVANNTINHDAYPEIHESRPEIKRQLNIPFDKVVLSVGRMGADGGRKKIDHLIRVFSELTCPSFGLVIVGSGVTAEQLEMMKGKNILYFGEVYDPGDVQISKLFKMADVFCIPGHVGLGLNQAFYWGLPVVTEDGDQPPEFHYLVNGRNGFVVPSNDLAALKTKLLYLLTDDHVRGTLSKTAREDLVRHASIEGMFNGFWQCLEHLTRSRPYIKTSSQSDGTDTSRSGSSDTFRFQRGKQ
jgi:glycosyltransferase involved in cell wall biosynthesis